MTSTKKQPFDAFSNLDLQSFKKENVVISDECLLDKDTIKEIAEESHFQSRQPVKKREKITPKTFSLFESDCEIINNCIRTYLEKTRGVSSPSGSDIVRAALNVFAEQSSEIQVQLIKNHRGRGKK